MKSFRRHAFATAVLTSSVLLGGAGGLGAFQDPPEATSAAPAEQEVRIVREPVQLLPPQQFQVFLQLAPVKSVDVTAPADGLVLSVRVKLGDKVTKLAEIAGLDDTRGRLVVKAAKARLDAASAEKKIADAKSNADESALAAARVEAAKAEVELAELDASRLSVKAPFAGEVLALNVVEGQFVRAGEKLATIANTAQLSVEVPVDRTQTKVGGPAELKIQDQTIKAKVDALLPLSSRFEPLRILSDSLTSAVVTLDNLDGKQYAGQTVYCDMIPTLPVVVVGTSAIANQKDGFRKVQVMRDYIVRDVPVRVLAKVGTEKVYLTGPFRDGDELIASSTKDLVDGTPLRSVLGAGAAGGEAATGAAASNRPSNVIGGTPKAQSGKPAASGGF